MIKIFPIKSETYETGSMITLNGLMKVHFKLYIHVSLILAYNKKSILRKTALTSATQKYLK